MIADVKKRQRTTQRQKLATLRARNVSSASHRRGRAETGRSSSRGAPGRRPVGATARRCARNARRDDRGNQRAAGWFANTTPTPHRHQPSAPTNRARPGRRARKRRQAGTRHRQGDPLDRDAQPTAGARQQRESPLAEIDQEPGATAAARNSCQCRPAEDSEDQGFQRREVGRPKVARQQRSGPQDRAATIASFTAARWAPKGQQPEQQLGQRRVIPLRRPGG